MSKNFCVAILVAFFCVLSSANAQQNLRGWHTNGQTFLIWEHSVPIPPDTTYEIYTSSDSITSISNATWIGRVFAINGANSRLHGYVPDAQWKLPDTSGGTVTVDTNEAYFVVTPHTDETAYYSVVLFGDTIIDSGNTTGAIIETVDSVTCIIQHQDTIVTIYGHWIDGSADYDSGCPDYPIMGNEYCNGIGFNFAIWEPWGGRPLGNLPIVIVLHGGYDNLFVLRPYEPFLVPNGLLVTLDDGLAVKNPFGSGTVDINTFWTGYTNEFNRFSLSYPDDSAIVINYTARRVWWETEWLINNESVDSKRVSLMGWSMGGFGTLLHNQLRSDLFSAGLSYVAPLVGISGIIDPERIYYIFGTSTQNLPTNFNGKPGVSDIFNQKWRIQQLHLNWPFAIIVSGKNDERVKWEDNLNVYVALDSAKTGFALYWDERDHMDWSDTVHFRHSERINFSYLTRFRQNQSFPAFSGTDLDLVTPGRQPNPGNGDPMDGDSWGTWGGYLEWDTESIEDTVDKWAVTMWVVYESIYPNDIPEADTILANVTPHRLQQFEPQPGHTYSWNFVKVSSGDTLQKGTVGADSFGLITSPDLLLIKEPARLTVCGPVGIEEQKAPTLSIDLFQNYPNPFTQKTVIKFRVKNSELKDLQLQIYDLCGRLVKSFPISDCQSPITRVVWNGKNNLGKMVDSGIYFYKLKVRNKSSQTKKLLLFR